jgi:hypothetical protein
MPGFQGKMRLLSEPLSVVGADIEIDEGSLALIVSNHEIGEWPLDQVGIEVTGDGFRMRVDGEEFLFVTAEKAAFAQAVGVNGHSSERKQPRTRANGTPRRAKPARRSRARKAQKLWSRIDLKDSRTRVAAIVVLAMVALFVLARGVLTGLLLVTGMSGIVVACAAILDPILAARLPGEWSPTRWAVVGLVATTVGMVLLTV